MSAISRELNIPPRPLFAALAHYLCATKPGNQARMIVLNRLFVALKPLDQMQCRIEMQRVRDARPLAFLGKAN